MTPNLAEILAILKTIDSLAGRIGEAWDKVRALAEKEKDEKKRKKIVAACERRDAAAVRSLLFD